MRQPAGQPEQPARDGGEPQLLPAAATARQVRAARALKVLGAVGGSGDSPWYARGLKFRCTACGNCCSGPPGYVWISEEEVGRLAAHLGRTVEDVRRRYVRGVDGRLSLKERKNLEGKHDCIFLTDLPPDPQTGERRRGCGIYEARPLQCRTWPFWDGVVGSKASWAHAKVVCPGMDVGKHYPRQRIEELRDAKDWPDAPPSSD